MVDFYVNDIQRENRSICAAQDRGLACMLLTTIHWRANSIRNILCDIDLITPQDMNVCRHGHKHLCDYDIGIYIA